MLNRILDISEAPARLKVRLEQLVIDTLQAQQPVTIPIAEIAVLIVSHPQVTYTQRVLSSLVKEGGVFITCDERRLPNGMLVPLQSNYIQVERIAKQSAAKLPLKKRIWQQVIRAKIIAQAELLSMLHNNDFGLFALVSQVKSGDPQNIEARAARKYWSVLFGSNTFLRDRAAHDQNQLLNYGYTVLRAITARAICAAGLHPSIGIHHHNKYNHFCLADDLMEPFRVLVDRTVAIHISENGIDTNFDQSTREILLSVLTERVELNGHTKTLFDALAQTAQSLNDVFAGNKNKIDLPEKIFTYATS
ncbi:type II CRISPR-associated endonuclease Cas1 [Gimesia maris]|uniref:type II CRISPR-associated endonuclease Cas1 n=1 Tax=Gimesia maris TaxID=122 RepID=UPI0030D77D5D